jgi:HTH-type transcriptional regulator / antitoxin HigA
MADKTPSLFGKESASPGDVLRQMLEELGLTQDELAAITGRSRQQIIDIIANRRGITPEMAIALAAATGTQATYWLNLDSAYQLARTPGDFVEVQRRARLYEIAPVKEMQRRGWIADTKRIEELESELKRFFEAESLDQPPEFPVVLRGKGNQLTDLSPTQRAWCFRARHIAKALPAATFDQSRMASLKRELRLLAAYPNEVRRVADLMRIYGIRFVVVEPLPASQIDGAAFWLDEATPAIAMSMRFDRLDYFWFTLMHECAHIEHRDALSIDTDMAVEERGQPLMKDFIERRADEEAAAALIAPDELESFIRRVGPMYAKPNIIQFAHRIKIHPGIIVGQLQHRAEIGFKTNREMLPKVREYVVSTAVTDGWDHQISPDTI